MCRAPRRGDRAGVCVPEIFHFPVSRVPKTATGVGCRGAGGSRGLGMIHGPGEKTEDWVLGHVDKSRGRDGGQQFDALGGAEIAVGRTADRTEAGSGGRTGAGEGTGASGRRRTSRFSSERRTRVCGRAFPVRKESETRRLGWWTRRGLEVV